MYFFENARISIENAVLNLQNEENVKKNPLNTLYSEYYSSV